MALPDFFNNMISMRDRRMRRLKSTFTSPEVTAEAALDALSIAQMNGQNQEEIDRRAGLIYKSDAVASANKKIGDQLSRHTKKI